MNLDKINSLIDYESNIADNGLLRLENIGYLILKINEKLIEN